MDRKDKKVSTSTEKLEAHQNGRGKLTQVKLVVVAGMSPNSSLVRASTFTEVSISSTLHPSRPNCSTTLSKALRTTATRDVESPTCQAVLDLMEEQVGQQAVHGGGDLVGNARLVGSTRRGGGRAGERDREDHREQITDVVLG
jgi:hypothetical protein